MKKIILAIIAVIALSPKAWADPSFLYDLHDLDTDIHYSQLEGVFLDDGAGSIPGIVANWDFIGDDVIGPVTHSFDGSYGSFSKVIKYTSQLFVIRPGISGVPTNAPYFNSDSNLSEWYATADGQLFIDDGYSLCFYYPGNYILVHPPGYGPCELTYLGTPLNQIGEFGTPPEPPGPPPPSIPGVSCSPVKVPDLSDTTWWTDFFGLTYSAVGTGATYGGSGQIIGRTTFAESCNTLGVCDDYDSIIATDVNAYSVFNTGGLQYPGTQRENLAPGAGADNGLFTMGFESVRDGALRGWNVLQIFNVPQGFFGSYGYLADLTPGANDEIVQLQYDGSGTVTYLSSKLVNRFGIQTWGGFNGIRVGTAPSITYYQCSADNGNICELNEVNEGAGVECRGAQTIGGITYGQCAFSAPGVCSPTLNGSGAVNAPLPLPGQQYVVDGSGAVIQTGYVVPPISSNAAGLFDCQYKSWTDTLGCVKEILSRIAKTLTEGTNSLTKATDTGLKGALQGVGTASGHLDLGVVSSTGANLADQMVRGVWNQAVGPDDGVLKGQINMALYGSFLLCVILIIGLIALANKK